MASRWTSDCIVTDHKDIQANSMTVDYTGNFILLAGKKYIGIKNCDDTSETLKKFPRQCKYEVGTAKWNPTPRNNHYCAFSSNQKIELVLWQNGSLVWASSIRAHTRLITDLDWNNGDCNVLATSSIDTFIHIWDIRDQRRPSISFSAVAGANRVQWNKISSHLLASAHEGDVRIWDQRKGNSPVQYISAHSAKIYEVDWSPTHQYELATCSQDCTVKFFDVINAKRPESVLETTSPLWRARYTPFGEGLVTVVVPRLRKADNSLLLWNLSNTSAPVHTFLGNSDVVLEFEWGRQRLPDYQLITWSKDQSLRVWRIEPLLQKLCGHEPDCDMIPEEESEFIQNGKDVHLSLRTSPLSLDTGLPATEAILTGSYNEANGFYYVDKGHLSPQNQPKTLDQEFSLVYSNLHSSSTIKLTAMDVINRSCTIASSVNTHSVLLHITFPPSYPYNAAPSFQIDESSSIDSLLTTKLLKILKQTAQLRVKKNKICLEACLLQLVATLEQSVQVRETEDKASSRLPSTQPTLTLDSSSIYGTSLDSYIPYPKYCGAKFCSVDRLVCFIKPSNARKLSTRSDNTTPRSFTALQGNKNSPQYQLGFSITPGAATDGGVPFYMQDRTLSRSTSRMSRSSSTHGGRPTKNNPSNTVEIYDCSKLFLIHRELGENYIFDTSNVAEMCHKNAAVAATIGRLDLVQVWTLAEFVATPSSQGFDVEDDYLWANHPFAKQQIEYLISHYAKISDIQTAAMLCCAFSPKRNEKNQVNKYKLLNPQPGGSPYHTIHQAYTSTEGWDFPNFKQNRSNSWSESIDDLKLVSNIVEHREHGESSEFEKQNHQMLDEKNAIMFDQFKRIYADILHRWNLLQGRAQVMKFLTTVPHSTGKDVEFYSDECQICKKSVVRSPNCVNCKRLILRCSLCRVFVRGASNICLVCGHGGHTAHMTDWFKEQIYCPAGCGCECLSEIHQIFDT